MTFGAFRWSNITFAILSSFLIILTPTNNKILILAFLVNSRCNIWHEILNILWRWIFTEQRYFFFIYLAATAICLFMQDWFSTERSNFEDIGKICTMLRIESCRSFSCIKICEDNVKLFLICHACMYVYLSFCLMYHTCDLRYTFSKKVSFTSFFYRDRS